MIKIPKDILKKIPKLYSQQHVKNPTVWIKLFTPWTNYTFYGIEFDGYNLFFGYVVGLNSELGYFSLEELNDISGPGGLKIEIDNFFKPKRLSEVKRELSS